MKRLIALFLIQLLTLTVAPLSAQITGTVFRDYNGNGTRDLTAPSIEPGAEGVIINAYNSGDILVASYTSLSNGTYLIPATGTACNLTKGSNTGFVPAGTAVRLEFTLPASSSTINGALAGIDFSAHAGNIYGTAVRFVNAGATAVNINYAISNPEDYTGSNNPYVSATQQITGTYNNSSSGTYPSLYTFLYNSTGNPTGGKNYYGTDNIPNTKALTSQTGATWGLAYQRSRKTMYIASVLRRFSGFGPLGTGGIYTADMSNPALNSGATPFIDVNTIGIPTGSDPRTATGCNAISGSTTTPAHDIAAGDLVGKLGLGGIEYDEKRNTLWLVNLYNGKLYGISHLNPGTTPTAADVIGGYDIQLPSGYSVNGGVLRPWGVKAYRNYIYIGAVADGSLQADVSNLTNLNGYILRFDPSNPAAGFSVVYTFNFNYPHAGYGPNYYGQKWSCWQTLNWNAYAHWGSSPIISDIEFDSDGSIIVGVADRRGLQTGGENYNETNCTTSLSESSSGGDILRICSTASGYVLSGSTGCKTSIPPQYLIDLDGDPNAPNTFLEEFYWGDAGPVNDNTGFNETTFGGLAFFPGSGQVLSNGSDPENWHSGGVYTLNNTTGGKDRVYNLYYTESLPGSSSATMSKSNGIGDIELLKDEAPIEIGNRVWHDADGNGLQDAGETGISGVEIELVSDGGVVIATCTTDADGNYFFRSGASTTGQSGTGLVITRIEAVTPYIIRIKGTIANNQITSQPALLPFYLTLSNRRGNGEAGWSDNDGVIVLNHAQASLVTGQAGEPNHHIDFGFTSNNVLPVTLTNFSARKTGTGVQLNFTLAQPAPESLFSIERSTDGIHFTSIGQLQGHAQLIYVFTDEMPVSDALNYYRIKERDGSGKVSYSDTRSVRFNNSTTLEIFPSPASATVTLVLPPSLINKTLSLRLYNSAGLLTLQKTGIKSGNSIVLNISQLHSGIYFLQVIQNGDVVNRSKLLISH